MLMINILIYDDNQMDIEQLLQCIDTFFIKVNLQYQTHICKNKKDLIQNITKADLLFLDMEINNENGIDIGLELENIKHDCRIIITTNYSKYAIDGYKIHADRYFIKPINQLEFNIEMNAIIKKYIKKSLGFYDEKISSYKIFVKDILYIEFLNRKSNVHTIGGNIITTNCTLKYWYDKLNTYGFAYSYKAYLINFEYISAFNKNEIVLINNETIPLSRHYKKEFDQKYNDFLHEIL